MATTVKSRKLSPENIERTLDEIDAIFKKSKLTSTISVSLRLSIEDTLIAWRDALGEDAEVTVTHKNGLLYFKQECLQLKVKGARCNPIEVQFDDDFGNFNESLLPTVGLAPVYSYQHGFNLLDYKFPQSGRHRSASMLAAIVLAQVFGICGMLWLDPGTISRITSVILQPVCDIILGLIAAVAGPLVFFSVISGVTSIGDKDAFGRIGWSVIKKFSGHSLLILLAGIVAALFAFDVRIGVGGRGDASVSAILNLITGIFPRNFVEPFVNTNTIQIIFIAIAVGLAVLIASKESSELRTLASQANKIMLKLMSWIGYLIPLLVFSTLTKFIITGRTGQIFQLGKLLGLELVAVVVIVIVCAMLVGRSTGARPSGLLRKMMPATLIAMSSQSALAAMGRMMSDGVDKFGISGSFVKVAVPLSSIVEKGIYSLIFMFTVFFFWESNGMEVSVLSIATVALTSFVLGIAAPPVSGGGMLAYSVLFTQAGIPVEALGIMAVIDFICDFIETSGSVAVSQLEIFSIAKSLGMVKDQPHK